MSPSLWIRESLSARGIPFEEMHHQTAYTAQQVAAREHVSGHRVAKVVAALADGRPVELILPASRRIDLELLKHALGASQVRLASEEEMAKVFTDCEVGALPALRHWQGVPVLMDRAMQVEGHLVFQAGTHTDAIRVPFRDW
jgi:Ala-tRNA(Pro) deacylase